MSKPLLSPRLQGLLAKSRLRVNAALPNGGQGDRSGRARGSGLEFAEHRPYQPGDDLKHVDPHLEARLGEAFIRQYSVDAQLPVTILIDGSASMGTGEPDKLDFSARLAAALSYLALNGNDRVRLGLLRGGGVLWTEWYTGARNAERVLHWLNELQAGGIAYLQRSAAAAALTLPKTGLVVVISDWQAEGVGSLPSTLGGDGREVICVHVYAPGEANPELLQTDGDLRLIDAESGEELDVAMNPQALCEYRGAWQRFTQELREQLLGQRGLYVSVSSTEDVESVLLKDWTRRGLILL